MRCVWRSKHYQRFGFEKASILGLKNEYGVDEEYMIIRYSKRGTVRGVVKYSSEFALFSI